MYITKLKLIHNKKLPVKSTAVQLSVKMNGCCSDRYEYLEDVPIHLLHELPERTGHNFTDLIAIVLEYGTNFSGPGKDVFRLDRATGEAENAHMSNFLHPVFYYYKTLPTGRKTNLLSCLW